MKAAPAARPQTSAFGVDAYPDLWTKAAALLHSIVNNHPLIDGNKRFGWLSTSVFLEINAASVATASNDDVYGLAFDVAATAADLEAIALQLKQMHEPDG